MNDRISAIAVLLAITTCASSAYADPPHRGGLPHGLQKKYDRGDRLPPGWQKKSSAYGYGYEETYEDQYEPVYPEDRVIRIIRDLRDLADPVGQ